MERRSSVCHSSLTAMLFGNYMELERTGSAQSSTCACRRLRLATSLAIVATVAYGCVVFPATHTFFEPSASDGTLRQAGSCGFHAKDEIHRQIGALRLSAVVQTIKGGRLSLRVILDPYGASMEVHPRLFVLTKQPDKSPIQISSVEAERRQYRVAESFATTRSVDATWVQIVAAIPEIEVQQFQLAFPHGSIVVSGQFLDVSAITFTKRQVSDIYYSSINC